MKVTIITICLNNKFDIERTITSITDQSNCEKEYIVVDGGSNDGTIDILEKNYKAGIIDKIVSERDKGRYDAMNKGIALSTGDLIGFLNAGDWYEPNVLQRIAMEYDGCSDVIYGKTIHYSKDEVKEIKECRPISELFNGMVFGHPSSFFSRSALSRIGLYDDSYRIAGDYEWFLRCYYSAGRFQYVDMNVANFKWGGISTLRDGLTAFERIKCKLNFADKPGMRESILSDFAELPFELLKEKRNINPHCIADEIRASCLNDNRVAIYGYGYMGHLIEEVCHSCQIGIDFITDKKIKSDHEVSDKGYPLFEVSKLDEYHGTVIIAVKEIDEHYPEEICRDKEGCILLKDLCNRIIKHDAFYLPLFDNLKDAITGSVSGLVNNHYSNP